MAGITRPVPRAEADGLLFLFQLDLKVKWRSPMPGKPCPFIH